MAPQPGHNQCELKSGCAEPGLQPGRIKCCLPGAAGNLSCCAPPSPPIAFAIDLAGKASAFPHYWERCVGSGHGALTMREDWRQHVAMAHDDLGIQRVRFHGILDDDMSVSFSANETGFVNVDSTCDFLLKHNMSMVMELGFMPRWLARGKTGAAATADADGPYSCTHSINHYIGCSDPPSDFDLWGDLIYRLGKHLVDRYGVDEMADRWEFEVWNEPGPQPNGDWWGTPAEYFQLYSQAARALKRASPRLQVGGPAGCGGAWGNHGAVRKTALFLEQCYHKNDHFAKTGSGQTYEKLRTNGFSCRTA